MLFLVLLVLLYVAWRNSPELRQFLLRSGGISRETALKQGFDTIVQQVKASLLCKLSEDSTLSVQQVPLLQEVYQHQSPASGSYTADVNEYTIVTKHDDSIYKQGTHESSTFSVQFIPMAMNPSNNTSVSESAASTTDASSSSSSPAMMESGGIIGGGDGEQSSASTTTSAGGDGLWMMRGSRTNTSTVFYAIEQGLYSAWYSRTGSSNKERNCYWVEQRTADRLLVVGRWSPHEEDNTLFFEGEWLSDTGLRGRYTVTTRTVVDSESTGMNGATTSSNGSTHHHSNNNDYNVSEEKTADA